MNFSKSIKNRKVFHTTKYDLKWISGELVAASKGVKRPPHSIERIQRIKETTSFKELNTLKIKRIYCDFIDNKGNVASYHDDKCKQKFHCI